MYKPKRLYNLEVMGGESFKIQPEGNPAYEHDGNRSLGQLLLSKDEYAEFCKLVESHGAKLIHNEIMTLEERRAERDRRRKAAGLDNTVFWTMECMACSFCDLTETEMVCGVEALPPESVEQMLKTIKPRADLLACPLGKGEKWQS